MGTSKLMCVCTIIIVMFYVHRHNSGGQRADAARRGYDRVPMNDNPAQYQQHKPYNVCVLVKTKVLPLQSGKIHERKCSQNGPKKIFF